MEVRSDGVQSANINRAHASMPEPSREGKGYHDLVTLYDFVLFISQFERSEGDAGR